MAISSPADASLPMMSRLHPLYIVDDDVTFRESLVFLLETQGYCVAASLTAGAFLAALPQLTPGTVLVDLRMPDVNGFDVIRLIGDRIADFPVIVITGHGDIASAVRATHLGATDFLPKPVHIDDLVASIDAVAVLRSSPNMNAVGRA